MLRSAQSSRLSLAALTLSDCLRFAFISFGWGFNCVELYCIACGVGCEDCSENKSGFLTCLASP